MSLPGNGIFVVQGEMTNLVTAMRRSTRWGSHSFLNEEYDVLMRTFQELKTILNQVDDLKSLDPLTYLSPFLEVIRSKETTGPVTSLALSSIHKFLSYGLIDPTHPSVPATVEDIADAVTHAHFVVTDHSSDGVVLMKILQVLRTLMLSPEGAMLTDESVCEVMLSCFRICFETGLTELLRRYAEQCLRDMTQLIFMRLPQFPPEGASTEFASTGLTLKKRDKVPRKKTLPSTGSLERKSSITEQNSPTAEIEENNKVDTLNRQDKNLINESEITIEPSDQVRAKKHGRHSSMDLAAAANPSITSLLEKVVTGSQTEEVNPENEQDHKVPEVKSSDESETNDEIPEAPAAETETETEDKPLPEEADKVEEYINHRGIRFTAQNEAANLQPYGLSYVRELFRFLISLCNPLDPQNTSAMVQFGLVLACGALEVAADQIHQHPDLLQLVQNHLTRHLISLLSTERIAIFALDLQVSFLLFESLRHHLKYQMEAFFNKIIEIISADTTKAVYEIKEIHHLTLEFLVQMFKIPGFCIELYLNYDCDVYCNDVFEGLTKLLSQNVVSSSAYNIHTLSLEALMTIIEAIEAAFNQGKAETTNPVIALPPSPPPRFTRDGHVSLELGGLDDVSVVSDHHTHHISQYYDARAGRRRGLVPPPPEELASVKNKKQYVTRGVELFNSQPERGVEHLVKHGALAEPLDPHELAMFLRECPYLDKKMIGDYICKRSSREEEDPSRPSVLGAFADSFDFAGLRIDQALRQYLESFRLPGEAPLIFLLMERFAERWHSTNGCPFANTDAAFRLAYAIIMLNMDQHNHNAKKLNVPMSTADFVRNLRGCNGNGDFPQELLEAIFHSIKGEEMVMPAEQKGAVRDAYLWRVLQRRGHTARYYHAAPPHAAALLTAAAPPTVSALSAALERAPAPPAESAPRDSGALYVLRGLERCAALTALCPHDDTGVLTVDAVLLTLCKFTALSAQNNYIAIGVSLGQSTKAQLALRHACALAAKLGDGVRDAWRHLLEIVKALFVGRLLPSSLTEAEDYLGGVVSLVREAPRHPEHGLLSSLYSYIALGETGLRAPTAQEKSLMETAAACVASCQLTELLVTETKFLQLESLQELIRAMITLGAPPDPENLQMNPQLEDITIFFLELLGQTLVQNRDRALSVWPEASTHLSATLAWSASRRGDSCAARRVVTALLRTSARLMRSEHCAAAALEQLATLFDIPYRLFYELSDVISCGLYEVVKTSAQNVHLADQWRLLLALLAAAGAGAWPCSADNAASSRSSGSSDEERRPRSAGSDAELAPAPSSNGWILVKSTSTSLLDLASEEVTMRGARPDALARGCEALALVIRDVAHVTPHNCRLCVTTVRLFVRATLHQGKKSSSSRSARSHSRRREESSDEEEDTLDQYHMVSIQLLDLMHTLHSRAAQIFKWWRDEAEHQGEEYDLWEVAWMPLLQGIALYCTDRRRQVANTAIAYLQRALLTAGLAGMGGAGWEDCFTRVLFPLLERMPPRRAARPRANTILCKVFLHHLSALSPRPTFGALWLRVVGLQRELLCARQETLTEAALESLKNMLLVMHSVKIFHNGDGYSDLWYITWEKIGEFLPTLKDELFPEEKETRPSASLPSHIQPPIPASLPTLIPVPSPASVPSVPYNPQSSPPNTTQNLSQQILNLSQTAQNTSPVTQPGQMAQPMSPIPQNVENVTTHISQLPQIQSQVPQSLSQVAQSIPSPPIINQIPTHSFVPPNSVQNIVKNVGNSPILMAQSPTVSPTPNLITPIPVSGMVPIRNPLYSQGGLASSVLLQPLNEMISTPIGVPQAQIPILYPTDQTRIEPGTDVENGNVEQRELYSEYLNDPYTERKEITQEATIYDPKDKEVAEKVITSINPNFIIGQKSYSENCSPLHSNIKNNFGSTDNIKKEDGGGIFNFSSYFGSGAEMLQGTDFDNLMSTQEG